MTTKNNYFTTFIIFCCFFNASACSMFKITNGDQTFVGNNEGYWDPNGHIWFEKGTETLVNLKK